MFDDNWWQRGPSYNDGIGSIVEWDDGSGPAIYAAGDFSHAGGRQVNRVARWDGVRWSPLGNGLERLSGMVDLVVYRNELISIYNTYSGDDQKIYISRWDGIEWKPLSNIPVEGFQKSIVVHEDKLYVGGRGIVANEAGPDAVSTPAALVYWDGQQWRHDAGLDPAFEVTSLTVHQGDLYALADRSSYIDVYRKEGDQWVRLDGNYNRYVTALGSHGSDLVSGGGDYSGYAGRTGWVSRWDGRKWRLIGNGVHRPVTALRSYQGQLYAGWQWSFGDPRYSPWSYLSCFDGIDWRVVQTGATGTVLTVSEIEEKLYVGGYFYRFKLAVSSIFSYDGNNLIPLSEGFDDGIKMIAGYGDGFIAAGGFVRAGDFLANGMAHWIDGKWRPLASGFGYPVETVAVDGEVIYVIAGRLPSDLGSSETRYLYRWDGGSWLRQPGTLSNSSRLVVHNGLVYVFRVSGGSGWSVLVNGGYQDFPGPIGYTIEELLDHNGVIYAQLRRRSDYIKVMGRYLNGQWEVMPDIDGSVEAIASSGEALMVFGEIAVAGAGQAALVAINAEGVQVLAKSAPPGVFRRLHSWEGEVYVTSATNYSSGANHIIYGLDNGGWMALAGQEGPLRTETIFPYRGGLVVGGFIYEPGDGISNSIGYLAPAQDTFTTIVRAEPSVSREGEAVTFTIEVAGETAPQAGAVLVNGIPSGTCTAPQVTPSADAKVAVANCTITFNRGGDKRIVAAFTGAGVEGEGSWRRSVSEEFMHRVEGSQVFKDGFEVPTEK